MQDVPSEEGVLWLAVFGAGAVEIAGHRENSDQHRPRSVSKEPRRLSR
jgi:hypothetical protein